MRHVRLALVATIGAACLALTACAPQEPARPPDAGEAVESEARPTEDLASLDGLVFAREGDVWLVREGEPVALASGAKTNRSPAWDSARSAVLSIDSEGEVWITPVTSDGASEVLWHSSYGSMLDHVRYDSETGVLWFAVIGDASTYIGTLRDGVESDEVTGGLSGEYAVRFRDSVVYAISDTQEPSVLWRITNGVRDELLVAPALYSPALSADGTALAVMTRNSDGIEGITMIDTDTSEVTDLNIGDARPAWIAVSPDGSRVAFRSSRSGTIWTTAVADEVAFDTGIVADEDMLSW